jgi:hypothetical protein
LLTDALDAVREEDKTINWFAVRFGQRRSDPGDHQTNRANPDPMMLVPIRA